MNENIKLLLIEDEWIIATVIIEFLELNNIEVVHAVNGLEGFALYKSFKPDICIIDVMLPHKDGISLVKEIRIIDRFTPLIFLSSNVHIQDVLAGFSAGADDYLKKPFSMQELLLRIHSLVKRTKGAIKPVASDGSLLIGDYVFNFDKQELIYLKEIKRLSQRESGILKALLDKRDTICLRSDILLNHWGDDSVFNSRSLDVYISKLRKYLENDKKIVLLNIRGRGYRIIF